MNCFAKDILKLCCYSNVMGNSLILLYPGNSVLNKIELSLPVSLDGFSLPPWTPAGTRQSAEFGSENLRMGCFWGLEVPLSVSQCLFSTWGRFRPQTELIAFAAESSSCFEIMRLSRRSREWLSIFSSLLALSIRCYWRENRLWSKDCQDRG